MEQPVRLPRPSPHVAARRVAGQFLAIPTARTASELNEIYALNEVAARIWELLPAAADLDDLVRRVVGEFRVEPARLREDVVRFLSEGISAGILEVSR